MRIAIGSDHAGYKLKQLVKERFASSERGFTDFGVTKPEPADYPDIAMVVAEAVAGGEYDRGILICGTGIGMSITANKVPGIRAALCGDTFSARACRKHNDANVLTLGERVTGSGLACDIVSVWLGTDFEGGRHYRRLEKIRALEQKYCWNGIKGEENCPNSAE
jgi:ribose 5-phosphate isomerase B